MHYLAKQTNAKIAYFHSLSFDYVIKTYENTLRIDCLSIVLFCYRNSLQQMFKAPPFMQTHACRRFLQRRRNFAADRSKRQPVAAWVRRHCGSASRSHAAARLPKSCRA